MPFPPKKSQPLPRQLHQRDGATNPLSPSSGQALHDADREVGSDLLQGGSALESVLDAFDVVVLYGLISVFRDFLRDGLMVDCFLFFENSSVHILNVNGNMHLRDSVLMPSRQELDYFCLKFVMAARRNNEQIQQLLRAREDGHAPSRSTVSANPVYRQFKELGPTKFKGATDPLVAEEWIRSLEMIYDFMQLIDVDKVRCAIFMLRGDARIWWEADYVKKFERGRYFVPMFAGQPAEELKHFIEGLRAAIRHDVRLSRVTTYREAMDQVLMSERDRNNMIKEAHNKRAGYPGRDQQGPSGKKPATVPTQGKQPQK
ncbi:hypothetical protein ZIOFF_039111 [Zingiber officinale]|uniref:Retrotransposon gag domain-containing protein n=1 Tax=Zingiber officinale TaxID=94328 RepID=A0A8J5L2T3_ZINOF|nr:hypothetical protein ZIOFF_039111 [Zingiber officinale]